VIKLLRRYRLAEDAGMGIDVMEDGMEAALLERPTFESDGTYVTVVFTLHSTVTPQERAWIGEIEQRGQITSSDRVVLLHAARGEVLTNSRVRELLGVDSVHARASLIRLRDLGYLAQSGERAGSNYSLARELGPPGGLELGPAELRALILSIANEAGRVTNENVRRRTGLERAPVLAVLNAMVRSGELERHGERRGSYYTPLEGDGAQ
jgi:ATP-dependent DNA helicase RecG